MNLRRVSLLKRFLFCAAMLIWGSMFFAFVFISGYEDTFIYLGGQHGYYLSEMMITNVGIPGTILLLAGVFLIIAIFSSKRTIPFLQSVLSFGWLKNRLKREKKEVSEEEDINEDDEEEVADQVVTDQPDERPETEEFVFDTEKEIETARKEESRKKTEVYSTISHDDAFEVTVPQEEEVYDAPNAENQPDDPEDLPGDPRFTVEVPAGDDEVYDASSLGEYDPKLDLSNFRNPPIELLKKYDVSDHQVDMEEQMANQKRIKQTLESFGISIASIKATVGPTITLYEVIPDTGVRISKIKNLEDDIALNLSALGIRIIAPMPGKGTIGIEVPNKDPQIVSMQSVVASRKFQESKYDLPVVLGKTITNEIFMFDLCKMPHLLVAGATGQGKSVGLNAVITSLLYRKHPSELKFVMVDPKMVELAPYNGIPHLLIPVVTDPKKAAGALQWAVYEMMKRYKLFSERNVKDLAGYNALAAADETLKKLPSVVVVIDELADLMLVAAKEVEESICRVAQMGRAAGMHLVIATQRPSADVITGLMKANIPSRIAFAVASSLESRIILDTTGAEKLVGRGDMLYAPLGEGKPRRVQGCFISAEEIDRVVGFVKANGAAQYDESVIDKIEQAVAEKEKGGKGAPSGAAPEPVADEGDELLPAAIDVVMETGQASVSMLQRRLKLGYSRAARIVDEMEQRGIVGPFEGSKPRQLLITREKWEEIKLRGGLGAMSSAAMAAQDAAAENPPVEEEIP